MIKRTSLNLDLDLVAQARDVLETRTTTETITAPWAKSCGERSSGSSRNGVRS